MYRVRIVWRNRRPAIFCHLHLNHAPAKAEERLIMHNLSKTRYCFMCMGEISFRELAAIGEFDRTSTGFIQVQQSKIEYLSMLNQFIRNQLKHEKECKNA